MQIQKNENNIKDAIGKIETKFGKEAIMILGKTKMFDVETFPSGSFVIDKLLGINGYPKGRIIEVYGPESSGKTTVALHAIAEIQKIGGTAAFIDAEHSIDPNYAKKLGVDTNNLILSQPSSGEQALEIVNTLVKSNAIDLIIIDSVAALVPEAELNGDMNEQTMGAQARLMSKALRKITASLNKTKTTIIFINQIREKIGVMFGNPEVTPGGRALKFSSSIRMEVRRVSSIANGKDISGNNIRIKIVKNKLSAPFKTGLTEIVFSEGISKEGELIEFAQEKNIILKNGAWYKYKNKNIAQGKQNFKNLLKENKNLFEEIKNKVFEKTKK